MPHHHLIAHPLVLRHVRVERVRDITPRMRRITLSGEQLSAFPHDGLDLPAFDAPGFDDHIKLLFATDGDVRSVLPVQLADGIEWRPADNRQGRDYTPRRFDPRTRELDIDFVLHGHGAAATWARGAQTGDDVWFVGPKSSAIVPEDTEWVLLAGDETAIPAIARFLEERPVDAPVRAIVTVSVPEAEQELMLREDDRIEWVVAAPSDPHALAAAVAALRPLPGIPYVWAAAESKALLPLRRHASRVLGADRAHTNITGYWHAQAGARRPALRPFDWFAIRAGIRTGLLDAVADAPIDADEAGRRLGGDASAIALLVDALVANDVLRRADDGRLSLGPHGEELTGDEHLREEYDGQGAEELLALALLPEAIEQGASAWSLRHGRTLRAHAEEDDSVYAELVEESAGLAVLLTGLPRNPIWRGAGRLGITGPGALVVADALIGDAAADAGVEIAAEDVSIIEDAHPLRVLREGGAGGRALAFRSDWAETDVAVTAHALGHRTDEEAAALLRRLRASAPVALLVERLAPDGLSPVAVSEGALRHLAAVGDPPLDAQRLTRICREAGWRIVAHDKLGWGIEAVTLRSTGDAG